MSAEPFYLSPQPDPATELDQIIAWAWRRAPREITTSTMSDAEWLETDHNRHLVRLTRELIEDKAAIDALADLP